ncbi:MFS transporter [Trichloromonas sp.]|uniref:MFS transporter n=1 Tax=Trichloromonas sp. TaxID=3069249 RepID=UPI002A3B3100|nr:MFS transporter [Trichloromonas sp.]
MPLLTSNLCKPSRKWRIFAILASFYIVAYFYRVSAAVIAEDLQRDLGLSSEQLGNVSSALFYAFAFTQLPLGPTLDRYGSRRVIFILGLITALGAVLLAGAHGYFGALIGRALIGLGTACVLMGSLKIYTAWFEPRQFATLAGAQIALGNIGNLLATAPLAWAAATFGWRSTFMAAALLTTLFALAVLMIVRDTPEPSIGNSRTPLFSGWGTLVRTPSFWLLGLLAFFWYGGYMAVQGLWGAPYLIRELGQTPGEAAHLLFFTAVGFILGCPLAGRLSDRLLASRKKVLLAGQLGLLLLLGLFCGPLARLPEALLPCVFFLFGLCVSTGPILYAQTKELFPGPLAATAMTSINFFVVIGAALTQQIMGYIMRDQDDFQRAFAFPTLGLTLAWLGYLFCRDTRPR